MIVNVVSTYTGKEFTFTGDPTSVLKQLQEKFSFLKSASTVNDAVEKLNRTSTYHAVVG